jgi:DNA-binding CsgD family transcriptional regulator
MLIDVIRSAQGENQEDMLLLLEKFSKLFKKYGKKLNYEDAENDLTADFIELIKTFDLKKLNNTGDGAVVNFLVRATYRFYLKRLNLLIEKRPREISIEDMTFRQKKTMLGQMVVEDDDPIFMLFPQWGLTQKEIIVLNEIYEKGHTASEVASILHVSRQNINQIKKRAEEKLRRNLQSQKIEICLKRGEGWAKLTK